MIEYVNECVGCAEVGLPCMGRSCPNRRVPHYYCDECGEEAVLSEYDGMELCCKCYARLTGEAGDGEEGEE